MKKLFVLEYACAGGPGGEPFLEEGRAMLKTLLEDLSKSEGLEVSTLLNPSLNSHSFKAHRTEIADGLFFDTVRREMEKSDAAWIIAPESDGNLLRLTRMAESLGKKVIGPDSVAVDICGDKLKLFELLSGIVAIPHTELFDTGFSSFPCVVKLRHGAGCEKVFVFNSGEELKSFDGNRDELIIQEFANGKTLSAAILGDIDGFTILGTCHQIIKKGSGSFHLDSIHLTGYQNIDSLKNMVNGIIRKIPGLRGYWGIDFNDDNGELALIEINPRLTSSYPLYSSSVGFNVATRVAHTILAKVAE